MPSLYFTYIMNIVWRFFFFSRRFQVQFNGPLPCYVWHKFIRIRMQYKAMRTANQVSKAATLAWPAWPLALSHSDRALAEYGGRWHVIASIQTHCHLVCESRESISVEEQLCFQGYWGLSGQNFTEDLLYCSSDSQQMVEPEVRDGVRCRWVSSDWIWFWLSESVR